MLMIMNQITALMPTTSSDCVLTSRHCRAARAWLNLSQVQLAREAGLWDSRYVGYFEKQDWRYDLEAVAPLLEIALKARGADFTPNGMTINSLISKSENGVSTEGGISPAQSRAARAWLSWSREKLADMSLVPVTYIYFFEHNKKQRYQQKLFDTPARTIVRLADTFERANMVFLFDGENNAIGIEMTRAAMAFMAKVDKHRQEHSVSEEQAILTVRLQESMSQRRSARKPGV
jgi:hypothetical protein